MKYINICLSIIIFIIINNSKIFTTNEHINLVNAIEEAKKIIKEEDKLERELEHIRHNLVENKKRALKNVKREYSSSSESESEE